MRLLRLNLVLGIAIAALPASLTVRAWDDGEEDDRGRKLAELQLIRTADLPADPLSLVPFPWGSDALEEGRVTVRARRLLDVRMQGVPPGALFSVSFCRAVNSPARCSELGQIQSDAEGIVNAVIQFPAAGNPWVGFFTVARGGQTMFVSGFSFPPLPPLGGAAVRVEGRIASLNIAGGAFTVDGFTPLIRVNSETRFTGNLKLESLQAGMEVEVEGATQADGSVLASKVKAKREKD